MMNFILPMTVLVTASCHAHALTQLKQLGSFKVDNPAFATLYEYANSSSPLDKFDLVLSTFNAIPFSTDSVQIVKGVGNYIKDISSIQATVLTTQTTWPNEVAGVPEKVFGKKMIIIPDGFILPFKTEGRLRLMDISGEQPKGPYIITDDSTGAWFYHRVRWHDMDGDGDYDAVTCRAREPIFGEVEGYRHSIGAVFDVGVYDINMDGKLDLLVNNNGNNGSLFVYEIPDDFRSGEFIRHTIATGFQPLHEGKGKGAPGAAFPVMTSPSAKPIILLSGDDDGHAYLLTPQLPAPDNWQYTKTTILTTGSDTVGQLAYADVDGDGHIEIFVPSYSTSEVFVYRMV